MRSRMTIIPLRFDSREPGRFSVTIRGGIAALFGGAAGGIALAARQMREKPSDQSPPACDDTRAIIVATSNPSELLDAIYQAIDEDKIATWRYDDGDDFFYRPDGWKQDAWLRPEIGDGELRFGLLGVEDEELSARTYAIHHGRFIEMLLSHFDDLFDDVVATAQQAPPDSF